MTDNVTLRITSRTDIIKVLSKQLGVSLFFSLSGTGELTRCSCTILILGHLPSADNLNRLRSRDIDIEPITAQRWRSRIAAAVPLLRCFARLVSVTYCPTTIRHARSAMLLTELLGIEGPVADARLNNIDYGVHKGHPLELTPSRAATPSIPYEGGEAWSDVATRWRQFCAETLPRHEGELVLLAGQSGTAARMLRHICEGVPLQDVLKSQIPSIPFFSSHWDFPTDGLLWQYSWIADCEQGAVQNQNGSGSSNVDA